MKVLVTGGAGYIGSHACKGLALAGYEPIVFDNLRRGHAHAVKWGPLVVGDLLDKEALNCVFRDHRFRAVLHFAAFAFVSESVRAPTRYYRNNVAGTVNLVDAMLDHGCSLLVFSSTCQVYGAPREIPIAEDHPTVPFNPYGKSKFMVEQMLQDCDHAFGLRSVSLRYFNAAGADPDGEIGEQHEPEPHLIPNLLRVAVGMRREIEVFGSDYPTRDGTAIRDYVHVTDLADAHVAALRYLEGGGDTTALNIGLGRGYSVRQAIKLAEDVTGRSIRSRYVGRRPGDLPALVANAERAASILHWRPNFVTLEGMIETAWKWHSLSIAGKRSRAPKVRRRSKGSPRRSNR